MSIMLSLAASYGHLDIVKFIVDLGVLEDYEYEDGLDQAVISNQLDIVKYLSTIDDITPSAAIISAVRKGDIETAKLIMNNTNSDNIHNSYIAGRCALLHNVEFFRFMVEKYEITVDSSIIDDAVEGGNSEIVFYLLDILPSKAEFAIYRCHQYQNDELMYKIWNRYDTHVNRENIRFYS